MEEGLEHQKLIEKVSEYVKVRKELAILKTVDKGSEVAASLISNVLILLFAVLAFLFGSFALGFYLSEILANSYSGFLIVGGFYLLIAIILNIVKDSYLEKKFMNLIIAKFFRGKK